MSARCVTRRTALIAGLGLIGTVVGTGLTMAFAAPPAGSGQTDRPAAPGVVTIDVLLGCTRAIADVLAEHENDSYYLGTSYGNTGPDGAGGPIDSWDSRYPNGRPKPPAYMNCAGFGSAVITDAGGDVSPIANYTSPSSGYHRGNDTNASMWQGWTHWNPVEMHHYGSKEEMLASGILEKGDIIYMHPFGAVDPDTNDCHIGIFWGDSPTDDKFWHSSTHGDGLIAGTQPGNMISQITPKSPTYWYRVLKTRKTTFVHVKKTGRATATISSVALRAFGSP